MSYPATTSFVEGKVCVRVDSKEDEKLEAISIYRLDERESRKIIFFEKPLALTANQCVPTQSFSFLPYVSDHFSVKLTLFEKAKAGVFPSSREFVTSFRVEQIGANPVAVSVAQ